MGLFDIFGTGDQTAAANAQINGINSGLSTLDSNVANGSSAITNNFSSALLPFMQNYSQDQGGVNALLDATGANGANGNVRATQAFNNNPGTQVATQRGDAAIQAQNAATGGTGSGNEATALSQFNNNTTQTGFSNYVNSLQPFLGASNSAATGIAGVDTGMGNALNANDVLMGNAAYGADTSIGNANANKDLAGLNASANSLGAITGLAGGLMGFLSDENAKEDIRPVGELYDGQKIYSYRYKGDDPRIQIGLIAQNVADDVPDAVFDVPELGMMGVDYGKATRYAADLGRFTA